MTKARASEAFDLLKAGREKEARAILEAIVRDDMADAAVLETLGDVREKLGDKSGALDAYAGAVTHLRAKGDPRRALGVLELMLLVDEKNVWARVEAAECRWELSDDAGCWREVAGACEPLIERNTKSSLAAAFALVKKYADVLPEAGPALQVMRAMQGPEAASLCVELGNALRRRDKHDDALALYVRALELAPQFRAAHHARAGALLATGRTAEARVVVDQILSLDPQDLVALSLLERIAVLLGDDVTVKQARDRFERVAGDRDEHSEPVAAVPASNAGAVVEAHPWNEDTAELRADTEDDPTDLER